MSQAEKKQQTREASVRLATPADAEGISQVIKEAFTPLRENYTDEAFEVVTPGPEIIVQRNVVFAEAVIQFGMEPLPSRYVESRGKVMVWSGPALTVFTVSMPVFPRAAMVTNAVSFPFR